MGGDFNLGDIDWNQEIPFTINPVIASQHNKFMHINWLSYFSVISPPSIVITVLGVS